MLCNYFKVIYCFIVGGREEFKSGWTTHGDPIDMGSYALAILQLIEFLLEFININKMNAKELAFADDSSVAGNLNSSNWPKIWLLP